MKIIEENGFFVWKDTNEIIHREDGPAVVYPSGDEEWIQHGRLHRLDGPAVIWSSGYQAWYYKGQFHRTGGPAVRYTNGRLEFWIHGERFTEEDFKITVFTVYGEAVNT